MTLLKTTSLIVLLSAIRLHAQQIELCYIDSLRPASFRSISVVDDRTVWVSGSKGSIVYTNDGGRHWKQIDTNLCRSCDFRQIVAIDAKHVVVASSGQPSRVFYTEDGGTRWECGFTSDDSAVFIDGMAFYDHRHGVFFGDPIDGKMLLAFTNDGGKHWTRDTLAAPDCIEGEASYAASNGGLLYTAKELILLSGGKRNRLWRRNMHSLSNSEIPLKTARVGDGAYAFTRNPFSGDVMVVGGNYRFMKESDATAALFDRKKRRWHVIEKGPKGYRESVIALDAKTYVAIGPDGVDRSVERGKTWQRVEFSGSGMHVLRASQGFVWVAGSGGRIWKSPMPFFLIKASTVQP
jgi:photosystem II stability/assembly factor-like uncharacterized protein